MYNDIDKIDNHIDYFATTGNFHDIFEHVLYGYFYNRYQGDSQKNLKFTLYFADPFDPVTDKYGDSCGFNKEEVAGFNRVPEHSPTEETKNMQVVPLQYNDFCAYKGDCESGHCEPWRTEPIYDNALLNNIYHDRRSFFKRLLDRNPHQIKKYQENSILYKVTFDLPFEAIAPYVRVDKTLRKDGIEKTKNIYSSEPSCDVNDLFTKMQKVESLLDEMGSIITHIRKYPDKYKKAPVTGHFSKFDRDLRTTEGFNIENAEYLHKKLVESFDRMHEVLFQARYFDIHAEPKEPDVKKCKHSKCTRMAVKGSPFCDYCVQLNAIECNYCEME